MNMARELTLQRDYVEIRIVLFDGKRGDGCSPPGIKRASMGTFDKSNGISWRDNS